MKLEQGGITTEVTNPADIALYKRRGWVEVKEPEPAEPEKPLEKMTVDELKTLAEKAGVEGFETMKKAELVEVLKKGGKDA